MPILINRNDSHSSPIKLLNKMPGIAQSNELFPNIFIVKYMLHIDNFFTDD